MADPSKTMMGSPGSHYFLAIGASGRKGLDDIRQLLIHLGPIANATVMIVLHRPFDKPSNLCAILARATCMPVVIAEDGMKLERGICYIGEPASHLHLVRNSFGALEEDFARDHRNRTIDFLFGSLARFARRTAIGVVLSGSLDDGSRGLAAIHEAGGMTMVVIPTDGQHGMPENAIAYDGPVDCIGTTDEIAQRIVRYIG